MDYSKFIAFVVCLFFTGCSAPVVHINSESPALDHMRRAEALEDAQEYHQAAEEYAIVAESYTSTRHYKPAVRKIALLNIHPENSEADTSKAIHWLQIYLTLPLTPEEKESAQLHIAMLENINRLQAEIARQNENNNKLRTVTQKQSNKITADMQRMKELETELAQARIQLEEMKEVDLRMHTRRVNGSSVSPTALVKETPKISHEADFPATSAARHISPGKSDESSVNQKGVLLQVKDKESAPPSSVLDTDPKKKERYPYTVQVSSFRQKEDAVFAASKSKNNEGIIFTSRAHIPGKGDWYRVFIGFYQALEEAQNMALVLKNDGYPDAFAVKLPFAIRIEIPSTEEEFKKMEAMLKSQGYMAYKSPDGKNDDKIALLIGAFQTQEETLKYSKSLQEAGLKPRLVQR